MVAFRSVVHCTHFALSISTRLTRRPTDDTKRLGRGQVGEREKRKESSTVHLSFWKDQMQYTCTLRVAIYAPIQSARDVAKGKTSSSGATFFSPALFSATDAWGGTDPGPV